MSSDQPHLQKPTFRDLYSRDGLVKIDEEFLSFLQAQNLTLYNRLIEGRTKIITGCHFSELIIELGPVVEAFIGQLFDCRNAITQQIIADSKLHPIYICKRLFVQRHAVKKYRAEDITDIDAVTKKLKAFVPSLSEEDLAQQILGWLKDEKANTEALDIAARYAAWHSQHKPGVLFRLPRKREPSKLIPLVQINGNTVSTPPHHHRNRQGFDLTDAGLSQKQSLDQATYCLYCHEREKDSCRTGLDDTALGCPLDQKISEMNVLKAQGHAVAALAVICIDNPMVAATGHRICNDCMKACIFQKQDPVDVPGIETQILKTVLSLPYGFEIYSLLTRWNPLNLERPLPEPDTGRRVMVAGLGPAGFTLAHHLINDGHHVTAIDALKIEALEDDQELIKDSSSLFQSFEDRPLGGFGGVAEYGITARWDKNFLTLIRLILERRSTFKMIGNVRLGSTLKIDQVFDDGFDHLALCLGAGSPHTLAIPGAMAKGVMQASDFLMALQLTGAAKQHADTSLEIRMPVVVIGAGLTAVDTATEAKAYYRVQVEKFKKRYDHLCQQLSKDAVEKNWSDIDRARAYEFLEDAKAINKNNSVKIIYRRYIEKSSAYKNNAWELESALNEGIEFVQQANPVAFLTDETGHVRAVQLDDGSEIAARTVLIAIGTDPNTVIASEDTAPRQQDRFFETFDEKGQPDPKGIFTSHPGISCLGDLHPHYHGSVVKAMASAKRAYPFITEKLKALTSSPASSQSIDHLTSRLHSITKINDDLFDLKIHAPHIARNTEPGHFFRLQLYGDDLIEPLAINSYDCDPDQGLIHCLLMGRGLMAQRLIKMTPGSPLAFMGPTGSSVSTPKNQSVLLIGEGLGHVGLLPLLKSFASQNSVAMISIGTHPFQSIINRYNVQHTSITSSDDEKLKTAIFVHNGPLYASGSAAMLAHIQTILKERKQQVPCTSVVHTPMQCMMKKICGQCLQQHIDPITGEHTLVFSCANQNQPLASLDTKSLQDRIDHYYTVSRKLNRLWAMTSSS